MNSATHLQGIGTVDAKPAAELVPGDVTVWNFGYMYEVVSVERISPKFVMLVIRDRETGKTWNRRSRDSFLIGVTK